jgi:Uma2 family endonuclease
MATVATPKSKLPSSGVALFRVSVKRFLKMIDAGIFADGARVELLAGVLTTKMTKNPPHNFATHRLSRGLQALPLLAGWTVRDEKSVQLGRFWRPEPDIVVARGPDDLYRTRDPHGDELVLIVEVSDTTYPQDRGLKWRGYAAARVPLYWIVNLPDRRIEVYTDPVGRGPLAKYQTCTLYDDKTTVSVVIDGGDVGRIAVRDILP